jgi:flagellar biosynthesis/type III secretory pathway protein FliH
MDAGARILKAAAPVEARRIDGTVFDADRRVREMVAAAEERARAIVAEAEGTRGRSLAAAREEGRREGEAQAAATLVRAAAERDRLLAGVSREVAQLALAVARKVLGDALSEPAGLLALAEAAVAAARGRREVVVRLNAADLRTLGGGEGLAAALRRAPVTLREDPDLAPGVVVVETEAGHIDAGVEAQLEVLARALEEALPCAR